MVVPPGRSNVFWKLANALPGQLRRVPRGVRRAAPWLLENPVKFGGVVAADENPASVAQRGLENRSGDENPRKTPVPLPGKDGNGQRGLYQRSREHMFCVAS